MYLAPDRAIEAPIRAEHNVRRFATPARVAGRANMVVNLNTSLELPDLRHRVRRLNWFQQSFKNDAVSLAARYGRDFAIDDRALARAFLGWADAFSRERGDADVDRRDFVVYSGGLMLRELLRAKPARSAGAKIVEGLPGDPAAAICHFWPEGFLYVNYCVTIVRAILESDFDRTVALDPCFEDVRVWESFRENVGDDASLAIPFFDLLVGGAPNWMSPNNFLSRPAVRAAGSLASPAQA